MRKRSKKLRLRKKREQKREFRCEKCGDKFTTKLDLDIHDNQVHRRKSALREIRLLEQGFLPEETKIGTKFKGKNKIIIT